MPDEDKKHLVPVHEYVGQKVIHALSCSAGNFLLFVGGFGAILSTFALVLSTLGLFVSPAAIIPVIVILVIRWTCMRMLDVGQDITDKAENMGNVELLTPSRVGQLPAEETLVRASSEPAEPEKVLLRATLSTEETPSDQLLRTSNIPD